MFERVKFTRSHLVEMLKQPVNESARQYFDTINFDLLESFPAFTGMLKGKPAVCGGVIPYWKGRGYLWTVFDETSKGCFVPVFRGIKSLLRDLRPHYIRLEMAVPCDFEIGLRRAHMLGFITECERASRFLPDGSDCALLVMMGGV